MGALFHPCLRTLMRHAHVMGLRGGGCRKEELALALDLAAKCTDSHILVPSTFIRNCIFPQTRTFPTLRVILPGMSDIVPVPQGSAAVDELPVTDEEAERLLQQFYTAASEHSGSTGSEPLDTLLQKGLYGKKMPSELKGKKAADAFQQAFDLIGGIPRLALWADRNPSAFFTLYSKLIPSTVKTDVNARIVIDAPWMNPNRLSYRDVQVVEEVKEKP